MKKFLLKATLVAIFAVAMASANLFAQCPPTPDCHSNSFIYEGELTIEYPRGSGCSVTFEWCWRIACDTYYDMYINILHTTGTCSGTAGPFDPAYYKDLVAGCATTLVLLDPWEVKSDIPHCPQSSQPYWRLGHPSCVSDWYPALIQSPNNPNLVVLGEKISPCNVATLPATCWNVLTFCWEQLSPTERILKIASNASGAPSTRVCPPTFTPTDAIQQLTTVNCNSLCE